MNDKFEPVIGIEVHVELNTKTKMFCGCSADYFPKEKRGEATHFGASDPNSHTCPVCLGLPGALPYINKEAIKSCIKIGLALNCQINQKTYFERKNYFYPDLPKGYQISQLVLPIAVNGYLDIEDEEGAVKRIRINRAHQEEDTGKLAHKGSETFIDYNRSSVPLVEIVTEPDFNHPSQVKDYAKKLQQIFRYLGVSNADMERGDMRLEANVSVRPKGQKELPPYRVELKNINSFRFMDQAIHYEIKRQIEALEKGEKLHQETRGFNEDKKETYVQRSKEEAHDYRYFPEPDLPVIDFEESELSIEEIRDEMPELPVSKSQRFEEEFVLKHQDSILLTDSREVAEFFEQAVKDGKEKGIEPSQIANVLINRKKMDIVGIEPKDLIDEIVSAKSSVIDDDSELEKMTKEVIEENPPLVSAYRSGKTTVLQALVGQVMRKTQGKANAQKVLSLLENLLK